MKMMIRKARERERERGRDTEREGKGSIVGGKGMRIKKNY